MHLARAMGLKCGGVGIDLGGPEHVRIVLGAVDGIKESAGLLPCFFEQGRERGDVFAGPTLLDGDAGDDRDGWHWSSSWPVCLDSSSRVSRARWPPLAWARHSPGPRRTTAESSAVAVQRLPCWRSHRLKFLARIDLYY